MPYLTVTDNSIGPPTIRAIWPSKNIINCVWAADGEIIVSSSESFLIPTKSAVYSALLTADDDSTAVASGVSVETSFIELEFELITYNSIDGSSGVSRYVNIMFDIIETHDKLVPLSKIDFIVYQNGAPVDGLNKDSASVSYSQLANGWRFMINAGEIKHKFKSGSNVSVSVVVNN